MTMYLNRLFSESFVDNYVMRALKEKIKNNVHSKNTTALNEFLETTYGINIDKVLNSIEFSKSLYDTVWVVSINDNTIEEKSQEKVISLVKLIEYGNLKVKGLNVINDAFKYIKSHLDVLYKFYQMKGGK